MKWSKVAQSCPTLCNPVDCSLPGSSVHGILQARILEWVAISFSRGSSRPRGQTQVFSIAGRHFNLWATREAPGIHWDKTIIQQNTCTPMFTAVLFTIAKTWKQPKHPTTEEWIKKMWSVSSVAQSCLTLCNPMNRNTPGLPVHHQLPRSTQTHAHQVSDAILPSHPLSSPSPPAFNLSQHQGLFQWVSSSHQVAKVLELPLQHQSFQWTPRTDLL